MPGNFVLSPAAIWGMTRTEQPSPFERGVRILANVYLGIFMSHIPPRFTAHARRHPIGNTASSEGGGIGALERQRERLVQRGNWAVENFTFRVFQITELLMGLLSIGQFAAEAAFLLRLASAGGMAVTGAVGTAARGSTSAGASVVRGAEPTIVELGAGDLQASIHLARGGARVIAVDPAVPSTQAVSTLQRAGGSFIRGTSRDLPRSVADQAVMYFPWRIEGAGSYLHGFTWEAIPEAMRIVRPNGVITFVTESEQTAMFLAQQAAGSGSVRIALIRSTAAQAAPAASGTGVPQMSPGLQVFMVNIFKR